MVFSSNIFLFWFLPAILIVYYLVPRDLRNLLLFVGSLFFYTWGAGTVVVPFLIGVVVTYIGGALIATSSGTRAKWIMIATVAADLAILLYYKYYNFFCDQVSALLGVAGVEWKTTLQVALPIGVSFFVFQALTYPVQIYRREQQPAKSLIELGTYLMLFPQLIAGPIIKYSEVSQQLFDRKVTVDGLFYGLHRFAVGLAKKVLIANQLAPIVEASFGAQPGTLTPGLAWLGTLCYAFQIYFDFSGYSDMAIGLAALLGFRFPENFNRPYTATSVTDFWRRWHLTLSGWFRDFVYVPLGGNRKGPIRTYINLFIVFFLCGLWHGAAWNFVVWGMFHGGLLVIERLLKTKLGFQPSGVWGTVLTCFLVFVGWVFFRANDTTAAILHLKTMFGLGPPVTEFQFYPLSHYLTTNVLFYLACSTLISWGPLDKLRALSLWGKPAGVAVVGVGSLVLFFCSAAVLSTLSFNPFIYFRF